MMSRWIAATVVSATLLLYWQGIRPLGDRAERAGLEYRRLRDERQEITRRIRNLEGRDRVRARVLSAMPPRHEGTRGASEIRRALLNVIEDVGVRQARLSVEPVDSKTVEARLSGEGEHAAVLALSAELVRPATGFVLDRVVLSARGLSVRVEASGTSGLARSSSDLPVGPAAAQQPELQDVSIFPARNIFAYADSASSGSGRETEPLLAYEPSMAPATSTDGSRPDGPRLVGFVRKGHELRAAISVNGVVSVVGPGDAVEEWQVLRVDREEGVTLQRVGSAPILVPLTPD